MVVNLDSVKEEVMDFMDKGKYIKPSKLLNTAFKSIEKTDIPSFGDLLVELARKYPELFIEKIYVGFQFLVYKKDPQDILYELDKYIIEKYCLLEGESITDFFHGELGDKYNKIAGRIFFTNLRVIASGLVIPISKSGAGGKYSFSALRKDIIRHAISKAIRKALNKDVKDLEVLAYGLYYPIYNAYKIKREKSAVSYNVDVEYERKGKTKVENLKLRISPGKMKEDLTRKEEILSNIEKILVQNQ